MTQKEARYNECIKIINYATAKGCSITQACHHFKKHEGFIRDTKRRNKPTTASEKTIFQKLNDLYSKFFLSKLDDVKNEFIHDTDDGLLDKDHVVDSEESSRTETENTLELDFRGNEIIKTSEKLLEVAKVDLDLWRLDKEVVNKWDVTMKGNDGEPVTAQNFQVKVWLSKKKDVAQVFNAAEKYKELLDEYEHIQYKPVQYNKAKFEKNLLEITIFDLHIGKLCWAGETGENYDVKIASDRFITAIKTLLQRAAGFNYERILFPVGNDFFNSDTMLNTTTAGTPVDEDLRWHKTYKLAKKLLVQGIDLLREHAPVDVVIVPGNHDEQRSYFVGEDLSSWYRSDPNVTVDTGASMRKYYKYGKVLLGLTHGNNEKEALLPQLMATEQREDWAKALFCEWQLGHFHKKKTIKYPVLDENLGMTIRYLSSLSGTDAWHNKKGFVKNTKAAEAFLWSHDNGLIGQFNVNIVDPKTNEE